MFRPDLRFEGVHLTLVLKWPAQGVVHVVFAGKDTGELGDAPFERLNETLQPGTELFIDARLGRVASIDVSGAWARWLGKNRSQFTHVSMLTGSRFIELSAQFVQRFAQLGDLMRLYTDAVAFDQALELAVASRGG